ncbi:MAG: DUF4291 domain-containing protein [Hyphomicrobiales bacterium]
MAIPTRQIRAIFDEETITVYQAFNKHIAEAALKAQTFVPPFKKERMTWIKPSFLWMMYRSGWASKENQEIILSIKIKREGFDWIINHSCLSHFTPEVYASQEEWNKIKNSSPVRIQWDPEKDIHLNALNYKSLQIGMKAEAVQHYIDDWIVSIKDITGDCKAIKRMIDSGDIEKATELLPLEEVYNLKEHIGQKINICKNI